MNETLLLTSMLLKENITFKGGTKKQKTKNLLIIIGLVALLALYIGIFGFLFVEMINEGLKYDAINMGLSLLSIMLILTILNAFPAVFYFSKDLPVLLSMPLKPQSIIMAKSLVLFVYQLPLVALLGLPMVIAAFITGAFSIFQVILILVGTLCVSWSTVVIVGALTILLIRCFPSLANKDRFMKIFGVIALIFAVGIYLASMSLGESLGESLGAQEALNLSVPEGIFFPVWVTINAIRSQNVLWILAMILVPMALSMLFMWLARTVYLKSAVTASANVSKKKKAAKADTGHMSMTALFRKNELRSLFRTPSYFTNCIMAIPLLPIILDVAGYMNMQKIWQELGEVDLGAALEGLGIPLGAIGLTAGMVCGFVLSMMNGICATAISRQGINGVHFLKTIPVPIRDFLTAELEIGTVLSLVSVVLCLPLLFFIFKPCPPILVITFLLGSIPAALLINQIDLLTDLMHPKLVWQEETAVIKNNLNVFLVMLVAMAAVGLLGLLYWFLPVSVMWKTLICLAIILICNVALWSVPEKIWNKRM